MQLCASGLSSRQNGTTGQCIQLFVTLLSSMLISSDCSVCLLFSLLSPSGLPYWLREIGHIIFRANNEPFKVIKESNGCNNALSRLGLMDSNFFMQKEMEKFVRFIVQKLKDAELFASQGGPIILAQVR
jgi:hypothetical protein